MDTESSLSDNKLFDFENNLREKFPGYDVAYVYKLLDSVFIITKRTHNSRFMWTQINSLFGAECFLVYVSFEKVFNGLTNEEREKVMFNFNEITDLNIYSWPTET